MQKRESGGQHREGSQLYSSVLHLPFETAAGKILETVAPDLYRRNISQQSTVAATHK